jgi:hypothetical protein
MVHNINGKYNEIFVILHQKNFQPTATICNSCIIVLHPRMCNKLSNEIN